jgi:hypothetical protein
MPAAAREAPRQDLEFVGFAQGHRQEPAVTQSTAADASRPGASRRRLQQQQQQQRSGGVQDLDFVGFPTEKQTQIKQRDSISKAPLADDLESVGWMDQGAAEKKGDSAAGKQHKNQDLEFVGFPRGDEDQPKTFNQVYWVCDAAWPKEHHEQVGEQGDLHSRRCKALLCPGMLSTAGSSIPLVGRQPTGLWL